MLHVLAVDSYHWWGPVGWLVRNCVGNLAAGFIQVALAAFAASLILPRTRKWWERHANAFRHWSVFTVHASLKEAADNDAEDRFTVAEASRVLHEKLDAHHAAIHLHLAAAEADRLRLHAKIDALMARPVPPLPPTRGRGGSGGQGRRSGGGGAGGGTQGS
jgi:uncharacterized membrane protein YgcG